MRLFIGIEIPLEIKDSMAQNPNDYHSPELLGLKDMVENQFTEWVDPKARYEYGELMNKMAKLRFKQKILRVNQKYHVIYRETLV